MLLKPNLVGAFPETWGGLHDVGLMSMPFLNLLPKQGRLSLHSLHVYIDHYNHCTVKILLILFFLQVKKNTLQVAMVVRLLVCLVWTQALRANLLRSSHFCVRMKPWDCPSPLIWVPE
jgi:hypothetical protein